MHMFRLLTTDSETGWKSYFLRFK